MTQLPELQATNRVFKASLVIFKLEYSPEENNLYQEINLLETRKDPKKQVENDDLIEKEAAKLAMESGQ